LQYFCHNNHGLSERRNGGFQIRREGVKEEEDGAGEEERWEGDRRHRERRERERRPSWPSRKEMVWGWLDHERLLTFPQLLHLVILAPPGPAVQKV